MKSYNKYVLESLDNQFHSLSDKERREYNNQQYTFIDSNNSNSQFTYNSIYIAEFLDSLIYELNLPLDDIYFELKKNNRIAKLLYSNDYNYIYDRDKFQKLFEPFITKDLETYSKCLKTCLDEHIQVIENFEFQKQSSNTDNDPIKIIQQNKIISIIQKNIDNNLTSFKYLVDLGNQHKLLEQIPANFLLTKHTEYSHIINEKTNLKPEDFEISKLADLIFDAYYKNIKNSNNILQNYVLYHIEKITSQLQNPENFYSLIETYKHNKKEEEPFLTLTWFFHLIMSNNNNNSIPYQRAFLHQWVKNPAIINYLFQNETIIKNIYSIYPSDYSELLQLTKKHAIKNDGYVSTNYDLNQSSNHIHKVMSSVYATIDFPIDLLSKNYSTILNHLNSSYSENPEYYSLLINFVINTTVKKIKSSSLNNDEQNNMLYKILNEYNNTISHDKKIKIMNNWHEGYRVAIQNIDILMNNISLLKEHKINISPIENEIQQFIINFKNTKIINSSYYHSINELDISKYNTLMSKTNNFSSLSIDLIDSHFNLTKNKKSSKDKTTYYYDYPILFELAEKTEDSKILEFIFKNENTEKILNTKFKNKNIIQWFCDKNAPHPDKNSIIIEKFLNILINDKESFQKLIINDKKTLKLINELNSNSINKLLEVSSLEKTLTEKLDKKQKTIKI